MTISETKYKVQSLERGLAILRHLRSADAPTRNQDLVDRTGLPKATVSRLLSTLGALGYVRRIDRGSYVLAHASGRSGRAMLATLELARHRALFDAAPGPMYLEAVSGARLVPVYRWSAGSAGLLANGCQTLLGPRARAASFEEGQHWDAAEGVWSTWVPFRLEAVGSFVLTLHLAQWSAPDLEQVEQARSFLRGAAEAIAHGTEA